MVFGAIKMEWNNVVYSDNGELFPERIDVVGYGNTKEEASQNVYDRYTDISIMFLGDKNSESAKELIDIYLATHDKLAEEVGVKYEVGRGYEPKMEESHEKEQQEDNTMHT